MTAYDILPNTTKVWIYQASQPFPVDSILEMRHLLSDFTKHWHSHNNQLNAFGEIYHNQFIVLMVDESRAGASGCSIDKSVHFIKQIEQQFGIDLFDRMTFTYKDGETIKTAQRDEFAALYQAGKINDDTLVFDNLVKNKGEFDAQWLKPLGASWHKRMV